MPKVSKLDFDKALDLANTIEARRRLEAHELELKTYFKAKVGDVDVALRYGDIMIVVSHCERSYIDREKLIADMGKRFITKYEKQTQIVKLEVKKCG